MPFLELPGYAAETTQNERFVRTPEALPDTDTAYANRLIARLLPYSKKSIDRFMRDAQHDVSRSIDCTQCANCCKKLAPDLTENEIDTLASFANEPRDEFKNARTSTVNGTTHLVTKPCMFLNGNLCNVYAQRPKACSTFPHLDSPDVKFRLRRIVALRSVCPIVYNCIDALEAVTKAPRVIASAT